MTKKYFEEPLDKGGNQTIYTKDTLDLHPRITRVVVVGSEGKVVERFGVTNVMTSIQDGGRTLKVFYD